MSKRILIIDDEENIRRVTRLTLQAAGYEILEKPPPVSEAWKHLVMGQPGMRCCWTSECPAWTASRHFAKSANAMQLRA